uniref:Ig-like domain-containing protein n=1 Tax=Anas platyrhynchos TaxID=8839 RepID=A0A8B9TPJ4_ANAPL
FRWKLSYLVSPSNKQRYTQPKPSVRRVAYSTARIDCHFSGSDFPNAYIHWYQQKPGEAPQHLLYVQKGKDVGKSLCTLTVTKVTLRDAGTYYCARWDAQQQRAIGSLHKDVLRFLDHTLKCPKPQETCPPCLPISP